MNSGKPESSHRPPSADRNTLRFSTSCFLLFRLCVQTLSGPFLLNPFEHRVNELTTKANLGFAFACHSNCQDCRFGPDSLLTATRNEHSPFRVDAYRDHGLSGIRVRQLFLVGGSLKIVR